MAQWFVTGASAGIGREVTQQLLAAGHRVAATARNTGRLQDLAKEYPGLLWTATLDVTDTLAVRAVAAKAFAELGRIDVVFSNAGRGAFGAAEELTDQAIAEQVAVNLTGPIELVRAVLPSVVPLFVVVVVDEHAEPPAIAPAERRITTEKAIVFMCPPNLPEKRPPRPRAYGTQGTRRCRYSFQDM